MRLHKTEHTPGKPNHNMTLDEFQPYLLFLMLCILIVSAVKSEREQSREPVRFSSKPVFSTEFGDRKPYAVNQLIEAGEYLYILPNDTDGFVQVYDLKGNYQHSLFFLEKPNGIFSMAAEGDTFYFRINQATFLCSRMVSFWNMCRGSLPESVFRILILNDIVPHRAM